MLTKARSYFGSASTLTEIIISYHVNHKDSRMEKESKLNYSTLLWLIKHRSHMAFQSLLCFLIRAFILPCENQWDIFNCLSNQRTHRLTTSVRHVWIINSQNTTWESTYTVSHQPWMAVFPATWAKSPNMKRIQGNELEKWLTNEVKFTK